MSYYNPPTHHCEQCKAPLWMECVDADWDSERGYHSASYETENETAIDLGYFHEIKSKDGKTFKRWMSAFVCKGACEQAYRAEGDRLEAEANIKQLAEAAGISKPCVVCTECDGHGLIGIAGSNGEDHDVACSECHGWKVGEAEAAVELEKKNGIDANYEQFIADNAGVAS